MTSVGLNRTSLCESLMAGIFPSATYLSRVRVLIRRKAAHSCLSQRGIGLFGLVVAFVCISLHMRYCQIMQHWLGSRLNRSTVWRRHKRLDRIYQPTSNRGRRWVSDAEDQSFIGFTGAVVSLVLEKGYCEFNDLFPVVDKSGDPRHYHPAKDDVLARLRKSAYPPAMMAVAVCELIPLNRKFQSILGPKSS